MRRLLAALLLSLIPLAPLAATGLQQAVDRSTEALAAGDAPGAVRVLREALASWLGHLGPRVLEGQGEHVQQVGVNRFIIGGLSAAERTYWHDDWEFTS